MANNHSRFDDWDDVIDCNECARWWDSSCDGVKLNERRQCSSYIATRSLILPERIARLEHDLSITKNMVIASLCLAAGLTFYVAVFFFI